MDLFLSIDVGTTNWKVGAFTAKGDLVSLKKSPTITHYSDDGSGYYESEEIWNTIKTLLVDLMNDLTEHKVLTIACTGMAESVVGIDENGLSVDRIIAWFDTNSLQFANRIRTEFGDEKIFSITGLDINPIFSLSKLMALKSTNQKNFNRAVKWLQLPEFISYKLSGLCYTDYSLASRTMLFDIRNNKWSEELLDYIELNESHFATVVDSGTIIGNVTELVQAETGIPNTCKVIVGGHDHLCATIPAGATNGENLLDSSGTAESFIYVSKPGSSLPNQWNGLRIGRYLTKDKYVLWGGIVSSGASIEWGLKCLAESKVFSDGTFSELGHDVFFPSYFDEENPQLCDILFLPHLRGAGAPYWNPQLKGSFIGLRSTHTSLDLLNAIFFGLSFQSKMIIDLMERESKSKIRSMNTVGGGSKLDYWQQVKSNVNQRLIHVPLVSDATLLGAALLGAVALGIYSSIDDASSNCYHIDHSFIPSIKAIQKYEKLYANFCEVNDAILSLCENLSR